MTCDKSASVLKVARCLLEWVEEGSNVTLFLVVKLGCCAFIAQNIDLFVSGHLMILFCVVGMAFDVEWRYLKWR